MNVLDESKMGKHLRVEKLKCIYCECQEELLNGREDGLSLTRTGWDEKTERSIKNVNNSEPDDVKVPENIHINIFICEIFWNDDPHRRKQHPENILCILCGSSKCFFCVRMEEILEGEILGIVDCQMQRLSSLSLSSPILWGEKQWKLQKKMDAICPVSSLWPPHWLSTEIFSWRTWKILEFSHDAKGKEPAKHKGKANR